VEWVGLTKFDFVVFVLEFFFEYLLFEGLPLFLSKDTGVGFLSYFHLLIGYPDYWAAGTFAA
jgi:hypothetical protein